MHSYVLTMSVLPVYTSVPLLTGASICKQPLSIRLPLLLLAAMRPTRGNLGHTLGSTSRDHASCATAYELSAFTCYSQYVV
jgi:hypothetical protein